MNNFKVTTSCHGMKCLEIANASEELHKFITCLVCNQFMNDERYNISHNAGAFFQGGYGNKSGWILIEFWNEKGIDAFMKYVNEKAPKE